MAVKKREPVKTGSKQGRGGKTRFKKGQSGNPAGRPKGSRNKLGEFLLRDFCALWDEGDGGFEKLKRLASKNPSLFIRLAVSLIPKQIELDARQAVYVIGDRPLSADQWAAKHAESEIPDGVATPRRPAKRPR